MPRLDNQDPAVLKNLDDLYVEYYAEGPIDVCSQCFEWHFHPDEGEVPHPPYSDDYYECAVCGVPLYHEDD